VLSLSLSSSLRPLSLILSFFLSLSVVHYDVIC
jgi:hypothetical protein